MNSPSNSTAQCSGFGSELTASYHAVASSTDMATGSPKSGVRAEHPNDLGVLPAPDPTVDVLGPEPPQYRASGAQEGSLLGHDHDLHHVARLSEWSPAGSVDGD